MLPVLDDAAALSTTLTKLGHHVDAPPLEVIVVDGGSRDSSVAIAEAHGAEVVRSAPGRGHQMNVGARRARGEILVFLHADTLLPAGALAAVATALADPAEFVGGGFVKRYDSNSWLLTLLSLALNHVRGRRMHGFVGSQAMFVRRSVFEQLGGFREWPLLEDVDLSDRLRRVGPTVLLEPAVVVSGRRYRGRGVLRQIGINAAVLGLFRLGVAPTSLLRLYRRRSPAPSPALTLAVVIPTLDEAETLDGTLATIRATFAAEIIVADGGSSDDTAAVAERHGATFLATGRGRAKQMNRGAASTAADVVIFVHADTRVDYRHLARVREVLSDPAIAFGSFAIRIDARGLAFRAIESLANLRTRLDRTAYGDQAIFVRRTEFMAIAGFPDVPIAEDLALARLLRTRGGYRFVHDLPVTTSARRWQSQGLLVTIWRNVTTRILWELGVSPNRLRSFYDRGAR